MKVPAKYQRALCEIVSSGSFPMRSLDIPRVLCDISGVRILWVYHITWLANSACHVWGKQAWDTRDLSRNNWWVALLAFGEGWHNNHHAFEFSARHGLEWWQIDMTWYAVRLLQAIGLATDVKLPTEPYKHRMALDNGNIAT
ncbi:Palmitoyl-monogalactosyldiacylglycerol delta-7 desaturase [Actinidia chinensis var. chinensis]|uniref:Palmitoyl-monogalactosyldiacylglycerol delta-7 desaturase n=1 Tax=Actinidia chinensis var. chinensis TaxID=1590841 RepID=A0A2R6QZM8_ACTCC|nr:Palmitoyl-monogalactosyldiacylglycerol delta-7 desaturase [Actinidia chinensis var. chinensis]